MYYVLRIVTDEIVTGEEKKSNKGNQNQMWYETQESHEISKSKLHNKITSEMLCECSFRIVYQFSQHYFSRISYLVSRTTSIDRRMMKHDT